MYKWFLSLKQPDGSFLVSHDAEIDVRGLYCLLVTATLLNLLTPELLEGVPEFIASCQSYEGGFSSSSMPYFDGTRTSNFPRPSLGEAHGGYTFSCLASWVLVQPYLAALRESGDLAKASVAINLKSLLRWMVICRAVNSTSADLGAEQTNWSMGVILGGLEGVSPFWRASEFRSNQQRTSPSHRPVRKKDGTTQMVCATVIKHMICGSDLPVDSLYSRQGSARIFVMGGSTSLGRTEGQTTEVSIFVPR
jgi:hypothetical protein